MKHQNHYNGITGFKMKTFKTFMEEGVKLIKQKHGGYMGSYNNVDFLVIKDLNSKYWGHIIDPESKRGSKFEPVAYGWDSKKQSVEHAIKEI
jgi:hypothetical protein